MSRKGSSGNYRARFKATAESAQQPPSSSGHPAWLLREQEAKRLRQAAAAAEEARQTEQRDQRRRGKGAKAEAEIREITRAAAQVLIEHPSGVTARSTRRFLGRTSLQPPSWVVLPYEEKIERLVTYEETDKNNPEPARPSPPIRVHTEVYRYGSGLRINAEGDIFALRPKGGARTIHVNPVIIEAGGIGEAPLAGREIVALRFWEDTLNNFIQKTIRE